MLRDATATAAAVRSEETAPSDEVEEAIGRADAVNGQINAIVEPTYDRARTRATEIPTDGPLAGVPILLKDLFCPVEGDPAYQGNRALKEADVRYDHTGSVGRRFADAGAISIGRSHSPEMGCGQCPAAAETALYGPTRNPWDLAHSPLGSSGGAAAAVAAGIVAMAHASDGGGSIRLPASANGLVGLKPSRGRISSSPAGELWAGGVTDGVVTRTVRDAALGLDVLAGPEPGDPYRPLSTSRPYVDEVGVDPGSLRIGLVTELPYASTDPACVAATEAAATVLEGIGHTVAPGHPEPMNRLDYMYDFIRVIRVSLVTELAMFEAQLGRRFTEDDVEEGTWINYSRGARVSGPDYVSSRERLHQFTREMVSWWDEGDGEGHDLLLTPTVAIPPPPIGYLVDGEERELTSRLAGVTPFLPQFNVTGQPAISVPLGMSPDGLPIGVQLVAAPGREDVLIQVAAQLEHASPWTERRPVVSAES